MQSFWQFKVKGKEVENLDDHSYKNRDIVDAEN